MSIRSRLLGLTCAIAGILSTAGCIHFGPGCSTCGGGGCGLRGRFFGGGCDPCGAPCGAPCGYNACGPCGGCGCGPCGGCFGRVVDRAGACYGNTAACLTSADIRVCGAFAQRSNAIPETLPLGSTVQAWYQVMQTNAEASDFIVHLHDFEGQTAKLTPDGRDHVWEIAARMRSAPFPVIVERSENNSDPELDSLRRQLVACVLSNFGNPDADQRTIVAPSYGPGYNAMQAEPTYYQYLQSGNFGGGYGTFGNNMGIYGGFGGGAGGGIGFGN